MAGNMESREKALAKLLPYQKKDFVGLFKAMEGYPVTVRLLDPPLHEFLPKEKKNFIFLNSMMLIILLLILIMMNFL